MKKVLLLLVAMIFCQAQLSSQTWFDVNMRAGWAPGFLIHANILDDASVEHKFSSGYEFGGRFGINFADAHGLALDVTTLQFNQNFIRSADGIDINPGTELVDLYPNVSVSSLNISLLYRRIDKGRYLELGPSYSKISSEPFQDGWSAVFGFGRSLAGNNRFSVNAGMRFRYFLTDINNAQAAAEHYPGGKIYDSYNGVNPLSATVYLEFDWAVGLFGKSNCYKGRRFIFFAG